MQRVCLSVRLQVSGSSPETRLTPRIQNVHTYIRMISVTFYILKSKFILLSGRLQTTCNMLVTACLHLVESLTHL